MKIQIQNRQRILRIDQDKIKSLISAIVEQEGITGNIISLIFVNNRTISRLNRKYLNRTGPTDVIAFNLPSIDDDKIEETVSGEIFISAEQAKKRSSEFDQSTEDELALYVIHGLLHICGYDDHDKEQALKMRSKENDILLAHWKRKCKT